MELAVFYVILIAPRRSVLRSTPLPSEEAKQHNIEIHSALSDIKDNSIDIVISNHAIEHVIDPAAQIKDIARVLKPGGQAILVVPAESPSDRRFIKWLKDDPDHHIFSWTPLSFGNLIGQCGLEIEKSVRRPIGYSKAIQPLAKINEGLFQLARHGAAFVLKRYEVACFAKKP